MKFEERDLEFIKCAAIETIWNVQDSVRKLIALDPARALNPDKIEGGGKVKPAVHIDIYAEIDASLKLNQFLKPKYPELQVLGEETLLNNPGVKDFDGLVVLMDMVDGTDLLERNLSNWCSALVFYHPAQHQILGAFIGIPDQLLWDPNVDKDATWIRHHDTIYFSMYGDHHVSKAIRKTRHPYPHTLKEVTGPRTDCGDLAKASLSFYGQQVSNLFPDNPAFDALRRNLIKINADHKDAGEKLALRLYTLAGNPLMMHLIDPYVAGKAINVVFDLCGQAPHDVVPGAYLALKAQAKLYRLSFGIPQSQPHALSEIELAMMLDRPAATASKLYYVLACSEQVAAQFMNCLRPPT
ncbi:MAG: hypothetical protein HY706_19235 [Candidatus Hydrogenedentes bacterium]|nr:hypothetical protein [Candidatus Hydrogenedentota bacterium]